MVYEILLILPLLIISPQGSLHAFLYPTLFSAFFSHFQKDLFLRTDESHTEKMNRPDCLVLSTHRWGQIFRRAQSPRRHLNKWQILRNGNVPTSFGAQLVLELLWKNLLWYGCSSLMLQDFHISSFVLYLCLSAMLTLVPYSIPQVSVDLLLLVAMSFCTIKRSAYTYTHISVKGPIRANAPKCRTYVQHKLIVKANVDWSLVTQPAGYTIRLKCIVQV